MKHSVNTDNGLFKLSLLVLSFAVLAGLATSATFGDASLEPANPEPGATVSNQQVVFDVNNLSADGDTDTFYIEFPDVLEGNISVNQASMENVSISSSAELVDGVDNDSIVDTVAFSVSPSDTENVDTTAYVDASVTYPNESMELEFKGTVEDSKTGTSKSTLVTTYLGQRDTTDETNTDNQTDTDSNNTTDSDSQTSDDSTDQEQTQTEDNQTDTNDDSNNTTETDNQTEDNQTQNSENNTSSGDNQTNTGNDSYTPEGNQTTDNTQNQSQNEGIITAIVNFFTGLF